MAANPSSHAQKHLAVLIDADNAQSAIVEGLFEEIAKYGVANVKRIYGDWTGPQLGGWKKVLLENSIQPIQQFACKRSINPTWLKIGKAFSCEVEVRSSTAARLRNPLPMSPLANVQVRGAATHRIPGRWLWQSRPDCTVEHWPSRPWACR